MLSCVCACLSESRLQAIGLHLRTHWKRWFIGSVLLFLWAPGVDKTVSGWFYDPATGWLLQGTTYGQIVLKGLFPLALLALLAFVGRWLLTRLGLKPETPIASGRVILYLIATLTVGPGIIVNTILKDHWGRARPSQITLFDGRAMFTPPWVVSNQCYTNCSFPSGHASLGFWAIAIALLAPPEWRGRAVAGAVLFGSVIGLTRIAQGGHFLSDVVYSGIIVAAVAWGFRRWLLPDLR